MVSSTSRWIAASDGELFAALDPMPPMTPVGMGKATRGVELESIEDLDERQVAEWMKQVTSVPGVGGKKS